MLEYEDHILNKVLEIIVVLLLKNISQAITWKLSTMAELSSP